MSSGWWSLQGQVATAIWGCLRHETNVVQHQSFFRLPLSWAVVFPLPFLNNMQKAPSYSPLSRSAPRMHPGCINTGHPEFRQPHLQVRLGARGPTHPMSGVAPHNSTGLGRRKPGNPETYLETERNRLLKTRTRSQESWSTKKNGWQKSRFNNLAIQFKQQFLIYQVDPSGCLKKHLLLVVWGLRMPNRWASGFVQPRRHGASAIIQACPFKCSDGLLPTIDRKVDPH